MSSSSSFTPYNPPVSIASLPSLAVPLCTLGLALMAWFVVYETTTPKVHRGLFKELTLAVAASIILGLGLFFLLLWTGVYV